MVRLPDQAAADLGGSTLSQFGITNRFFSLHARHETHQKGTENH